MSGPDDGGDDTHAADDALVGRLRRIADAADPPPALVGELARAALATRLLDAELAALVLDSADDPAAVRSGAGPRVLSFEHAAVPVEVQVEGRTLRGLVPAGAVGAVTVEPARPGADTVTLAPDAAGWLGPVALPAGPWRLRLRLADGRAVVTPWMGG